MILVVGRRGGVVSESDPRVVSSNPGRSVTCGCVPAQNTLPLIARVFSDRTLKIVGPFYLVSMPGEVEYPTRVIYNVTHSGLTNPSISWCHWLWASCAHHRLWSAVPHDTNMGARPLRYYAVGCLTTRWHKAVCRVYYINRILTANVYMLFMASISLRHISIGRPCFII